MYYTCMYMYMYMCTCSVHVHATFALQVLHMPHVQPVLVQCEPTDVENPRLMDDTKDLACKLIEEFDRIEQAKSVLGTAKPRHVSLFMSV